MILAWEKWEEHKWESLLGKINYMNPQILNSTFTGVLFTVHVIIIHQGSFLVVNPWRLTLKSYTVGA